jgi:hypothetical protein
MRKHHLFAAGLAVALMWVTMPVEAQSATRSRAQAQIPPQQKCLRALDGACTNPAMAEAARRRGVIVPSVRVSQSGTPAGTLGKGDIPFEHAFRGDPVVSGLPTNTFFCCNTFKYTK